MNKTRIDLDTNAHICTTKYFKGNFQFIYQHRSYNPTKSNFIKFMVNMKHLLNYLYNLYVLIRYRKEIKRSKNQTIEDVISELDEINTTL